MLQTTKIESPLLYSAVLSVPFTDMDFMIHWLAILSRFERKLIPGPSSYLHDDNTNVIKVRKIKIGLNWCFIFAVIVIYAANITNLNRQAKVEFVKSRSLSLES
jgi:hypothetical protein